MDANKPNKEQLDAVLDFAERNGRTWKSKLRRCWETGKYGPSDNAPRLQQLRNNFGPTWLNNVYIDLSKVK